MVKRVLGLDLGTSSIGWALVEQSEKDTSKIIKLGVRVIPLTTDEKDNFEKGRPLTTNANRTLKRGARRNLQRYKLRRKALIELLIKNNIIAKETSLTEVGKSTTHETLQKRSDAVTKQISLEEFARVLLTINKKRGYKSSRKTNHDEEGKAVDGMTVAKELYDLNLTPGEYVLKILEEEKKVVPDFYRSDLQNEFDAVWEFQKQFYSNILDEEFYKAIQGQGQQNTRKLFFKLKGIYTAENKGKRDQKRKQHYTWRAAAIKEQLPIEEVAYVLVEINNNLKNSSGYLGEISDRSKELYFKELTVGKYLWYQLIKNPHTSLKNQVFYRQDYLDEFEKIWETQAKHYPVLTKKLKEEIRDIVIFYQRKLKSQKGLLSFCQFESSQQVYLDKVTKKEKVRTIGRKVIAKSSPLFQEFKIWQNINNLVFENEAKQEILKCNQLDKEIREALFNELNYKGNLKFKEVLKILGKYVKLGKLSDWKSNFEVVEGNSTNQVLYATYKTIAETAGCGFDWDKRTYDEIQEELKAVFKQCGITPEILLFNANKEGDNFDKQPAYQLWHLLYATEDDEKISEEDRLTYGNSAVSLKKKLCQKFGFSVAQAKLIANVRLEQDYCNLSSKAIRKIIPHLQDGYLYGEACGYAGYNHSNSITAKEKESKIYKDTLKELKKNSLRNPVVEKILNQMINLVNKVIEEYGKPDEIRIELARELKRNAKERQKAFSDIAKATKLNNDIKQLLQKEFGISYPTKSDVVRYKLWKELEGNGYKDVFTNTYIPQELLFTKEIEVEHIIPKALLFDDSFSNKTLAHNKVNKQKSNRTAYDFIHQDHFSQLEAFEARVQSLYNNTTNRISKSKRNKLLMKQENIPDGFIERDLRNSQYIAKKAKDLLREVFKEVVNTSGNITDKLRNDWGLINVLKELNIPKYESLGLVQEEERLNIGTGSLQKVKVIDGWTKRNDHRHHAMDALTVAFTNHEHIQYLNYLNARRDTTHKDHKVIIAIEQKITHKVSSKNGQKKRVFAPPMNNFRSEAKKHLEETLVSFKNKNKVVTNNVNKIKKKGDVCKKLQVTPRGQLHKETVYGTAKRLMDKKTKLTKNTSLAQVNLIANAAQKEVVKLHLQKFNNQPEIAFSSKTLKEFPIIYQAAPIKEILCYEQLYTIRKKITPELNIDKVVDPKIKEILQKRIAEYGNKKEALSDIENNPIWLNKKKGIKIKRVTITGVANAIPLHSKKDHFGEEIIGKNGEKIGVDFINTGNNHHVAVYKDANNVLHQKVVSFFEAVTRKNQNIPVIDKTFNTDKGWQFLFTMKQNEMFVFPSEEFDPSTIDLLNPKNLRSIGKHLYRVQKIADKDYMFRHHLETTTDNITSLKNKAWKRVGLKGLEGIIKVRINHIGNIVHVGEY